MLNRTNQRINYWQYWKREGFQTDRSPYYFAYGRTALEQGLFHLHLQNTAVLIPEYICETVVKTFTSLDISIIYYPINDDLSPKWDVVETLFNKNVKSILMVHYFGIPQAINNFKKFANNKNIFLIEDNSHGCFGIIDNQLLGTFGDIGISSPRKSLPIINGGMLFSKTDISNLAKLPLEPCSILIAIIRNYIGIILDCVPSLKTHLISIKNTDSNIDIKNYSIDRSSYQTIQSSKNYNKRVEIYKIWQEWSKRNTLNPLFTDIPETIAPMCFPILCDSIEQKETIMQFFLGKNIAAFSWPDLPENVKEPNNTGSSIYNRTICLPIHLKMNPIKMKKLLQKLKFRREDDCNFVL